MVLPARTAWAASQLPDGARWPLQGPGDPPDEMLVSDEGWLAFAACRLVLQPADLDRAFKRDHHGQPSEVIARIDRRAQASAPNPSCSRQSSHQALTKASTDEPVQAVASSVVPFQSARGSSNVSLTSGPLPS